jgi:hypothetical protein
MSWITAPGVYDIPEDDYHADPVQGGSLSSTGARRLLPPSCPAKYRWATDNPPQHRRVFDIGRAAHKLVLGEGADLVVIDAVNYRTAPARAAQETAYTEGHIPLLTQEYEMVTAMAGALRADPTAGALFSMDRGRPEQSLIWEDTRTGVMRRARIDWLPDPARPGRMLVGDYKTCRSAAPAAFSKSMYEYGYHQQGAWYLDGVIALGLAGEDAVFLFVAQEKTPPYLVQVYEVDALALRAARDLNAAALDVYAQCSAQGHWPGYSDEVERVGLPPWAERAYLEGLTT